MARAEQIERTKELHMKGQHEGDPKKTCPLCQTNGHKRWSSNLPKIQYTFVAKARVPAREVDTEALMARLRGDGLDEVEITGVELVGGE